MKGVLFLNGHFVNVCTVCPLIMIEWGFKSVSVCVCVLEAYLNVRTAAESLTILITQSPVLMCVTITLWLSPCE